MDIFSNLMVVGECLLDKKRVQSFERAIKETVKKGHVVIDCGTGSGILALISAKAGASKVYAIEIAEDVAQFARQNVKESDYVNVIEVINTDIKNLKLDKKIDVVTAEMLDTCLVAEQQVQATNRLHKLKVITEETVFIPRSLDCAIQAIEYDFNFYGFNMPFVIQARNYGVQKHLIKDLSTLTIYKTVNFQEINNTQVNEIIAVKITKSGILNAIKLKSRANLSKNVKVWATSDMNMPVIVPINKIYVRKGEVINFHIKYKMGDGFSNFVVDIM